MASALIPIPAACALGLSLSILAGCGRIGFEPTDERDGGHLSRPDASLVLAECQARSPRRVAESTNVDNIVIQPSPGGYVVLWWEAGEAMSRTLRGITLQPDGTVDEDVAGPAITGSYDPALSVVSMPSAAQNTITVAVHDGVAEGVEIHHCVLPASCNAPVIHSPLSISGTGSLAAREGGFFLSGLDGENDLVVELLDASGQRQGDPVQLVQRDDKPQEVVLVRTGTEAMAGTEAFAIWTELPAGSQVCVIARLDSGGARVGDTMLGSCYHPSLTYDLDGEVGAVWLQDSGNGPVYFQSFGTDLTPRSESAALVSSQSTLAARPRLEWDLVAYRSIWIDASRADHELGSIRVSARGSLLSQAERIIGGAGTIRAVHSTRRGNDTAMIWVEGQGTRGIYFASVCP